MPHHEQPAQEFNLHQLSASRIDVFESASASSSAEKPSVHSESSHAEQPAKSAPKGRAFWLSFVAIMVAVFLSALDLTAVATALPTIANALEDTSGDYIWVSLLFCTSSDPLI